MIITIKLDLTPEETRYRGSDSDDAKKRDKMIAEREARLAQWLEEKYSQGSWNALGDARVE